MDPVLVTQLVDGHLVQRPMDAYQLLRAQQERDERERLSALPRVYPLQDHGAKAGTLGIMSRTLLPSPYIKTILRAKIRHKNLNDVVFVGEDFVHLKQATANGSLRHIATKSDFGGRILAARVFAGPQMAFQNAHNGTPIKRKDVRAHRRSTAGEASEQLPPEMLVLTLDSKLLMFLWACANSSGRIKFHHRTLRVPAGRSRLGRPGSFLAVAPNFRAIAIAAFEGQLVFYKTENMVKWRERMREHMDASSTPISGEDILPTNGRIIHMDFLAPSADPEDPHVILILVIAHSGRTKITCYDWVADHERSCPLLRAERVNIDTEDNNPSLLVPLGRSPAFLLVFNDHISAYEGILSGTSRCVRTQIPHEMLVPLRPGDSRTSPIWVQWERAERNNDYPKEAFYIAREDGKILYIEVGPSMMSLEISDAGSLRQTIDRAFASLQVDSDMLKRLQPDIFAAAGVSSDGYISKLGSWVSKGVNLPYEVSYTFETLAKIPNWAPTVGLASMASRGSVCFPRTTWSRSSALASSLPSTEPSPRRSILLSHGRAPYGAITEVRRGIEAKIDTYCQGMKGCTGLWIIGYRTEDVLVGEKTVVQQYASILCSFPHESLVLRVTLVDGVYSIENVATADEADIDGVSRAETLALGVVSDKYIVQVIQGEARIISPALELLDRLALDGSVLVATAHAQLGQLAIAYRDAETHALGTVELLEGGKFGSRNRYELASDPSTVEILDIDGVPHVLVGTTGSFIHILKISQNALEPVTHYDLSKAEGEDPISAVCESAVMLRYSEKRVLLCGLRNGLLAGFTLETHTTEVGISLISWVALGTASVRLWTCANNPSAAFASCGADFVQVHHRCPNSSIPTVDSIWFTDLDDECYQQQEIMALDQLPLNGLHDDTDQGIDQDLAGLLFTVAGDKLLLSRLAYDTGYQVPLPQRPQAVPRKWTLEATPSTLTFSERLQRVLVSFSEPREVRAPPDGYRTIKTGLQVVKLDESGAAPEHAGDLTPHPEVLLSEEGSLRPYERICSIVDWIAKDKTGNSYHHIVVGTGYHEPDKLERGRLMHYQIVQDRLVRKRKTTWYPGAIRSLAMFNPNVFIYGYGRTLAMDEYSVTENEFLRRATVTLQSGAVSISCQSPYVYVSQATHGLHCYKLEDLSANAETLSHPDWAFIQVYTESRTRFLNHHTHIENAICADSRAYPSASQASENTTSNAAEGQKDKTTDMRSDEGRTLILLADKTFSVTGVLHPPSDLLEAGAPVRSIPATFEARLPRSVIRLQQGAFRTPWARPPTGAPKGVLIDDIVGVCTDGTLYNFSVLGAEATFLLRYIQHLIEAQTYRCMGREHRESSSDKSDLKQRVSHMGGFPAKQEAGPAEGDYIITPLMLDPLEGPTKPKKWHVDADALVRYFDGDMMDPPFDEENALFMLLTTKTSDGVWRRFTELAAFLVEREGEDLGSGGVVGNEQSGEDKERFAKRVQDWVRDVTRDML